MRQTSNSGQPEPNRRDGNRLLEPAFTPRPSLEDPRTVLSLLEADQVVAAKWQTHFGARNFSVGLRILLWGLRIYVVIMLLIVLMSVWQAVHAAH